MDTTIFGLPIWSYIGFLAFVLAYFLVHKGAQVNARSNKDEVKGHVTIKADEVRKHIDDLDETSRAELLMSLQPEFEKVKNEVLTNREQIKETKVQITESGGRVLNAIDRNLELTKKLRTVAIAVELNEPMHLSEIEPFVFLMHIRSSGTGKTPSLICGNIHPSNDGQFIIGNKVASPTTLEFGWTLNPYNFRSGMAIHESNIRRTFISELKVDNVEGLVDRVIDLEGGAVEFYLSESLYKSVAKVYFFLNDLIVEEFDPNEIEKFPATTNFEDPRFSLPDKIKNRTPNELLAEPLLRFGRKGGDPRNVAIGFPDIESRWEIVFDKPILKVKDLRSIY